MRIFGFDISRKKELMPVAGWRGAWRLITEPFAGAWQKNEKVKLGDLTCYPTLYACLNRISQDVGKLPFVLKKEDEHGIWNPVKTASPFWPVLRKPNNFQTAQQFREAWMLSKLMFGNTYVLKARDARGVVTDLYVIDPRYMEPLVSETGAVYYRLFYSMSANLLPEEYGDKSITIPADEIIHDRINAIHHPLVGVPPLSAAYWPVAKNLQILKNATDFFGNASQPGGLLTAPAGMSDEDAKAVQQFWHDNYSGDNRGKIAVLGADMKFTSFAENSSDSQLVEQMQYSDRQICQPFGIPPYIVGVGEIPAGLKVDDVTNTYYSLALQSHIEAMENLLDEGLAIPSPMGVELDTEPLLRMDEGKKADVATKLVGGGVETPNEGRVRFNRSPIKGGDTVYLQQQNFSIEALAKRDDQPNPFVIDRPTSNPTPSPAGPAPTADPAQDPAKDPQADANKAAALAHYARIEATKRMRNAA